MLEIGMKVKLKNYTPYPDYKDHDGEVGTLEFQMGKPEQRIWSIRWDDLTTSIATDINIERVPPDNWREELGGNQNE